MTQALTDNWLNRARQMEHQAAQPNTTQGVSQPTDNGLNGGGRPQTSGPHGGGQSKINGLNGGGQPQSPQQNQQATQQTKGQQQQPAQQKNKSQQANVLQAVQEVANIAFPSLDKSLESMTNIIMQRKDLGATEKMARGLAVELVGAWIVAASTGQTSKPEDVVSQSSRLTSLIYGK